MSNKHQRDLPTELYQKIGLFVKPGDIKNYSSALAQRISEKKPFHDLVWDTPVDKNDVVFRANWNKHHFTNAKQDDRLYNELHRFDANTAKVSGLMHAGANLLRRELNRDLLSLLDRMAVRGFSVEKKELLVELLQQGADVNVVGRWSALYAAVVSKDVDLVRWMLKKGANPNSRSSFTVESPLARAIYKNDVPMVKLLLQYGANPINIYYQSGEPSFVDAAGSEAARYVMEKYWHPSDTIYENMDHNGPDHPMTLWQFFLKNAPWDDNIEWALKHGANANEVFEKGHTPLHYVAGANWKDNDDDGAHLKKVLKLLKTHGAKVKKNLKGKTPLDVAKNKQLFKRVFEEVFGPK